MAKNRKMEPKTFTDAEGRSWSVRVTVHEIIEVQKATGIDLARVGNLGRAFADTATFAGILWALIGEQAEERKLSPKDVHDGLSPETIEAAAEAVQAAIIDFYPEKQRQTLADYFAAISKRVELQTASTMEKLAAATPLIEAGKLDTTLGLASPSRLNDAMQALAPPADEPAAKVEPAPAAS